MIKLLLLLMFPFTCLSQLTVTEIGGGFNSAGVGSTNGVIFTSGRLYIVVTGVTNGAGTPATMSLTGTGQTWTQIGNVTGNTIATGNSRVQMFRYACVSNHTDNIVYNYTGTQDGSWAVIFEVVGSDNTGTNGSNAIVQSVTDRQDANANPTITLAAISSGRNAVLAGFINQTNPFTGTPESGWTESEDNGYNTPTTGGYVMFRVATTDNTPTVTAAASNWAGIAIEIKSSTVSGLPLHYFF